MHQMAQTLQGHGDYMTEWAQWGPLSEKGHKCPLKGLKNITTTKISSSLALVYQLYFVTPADQFYFVPPADQLYFVTLVDQLYFVTPSRPYFFVTLVDRLYFVTPSKPAVFCDNVRPIVFYYAQLTSCIL